jgi:hypothetical protein
VVMNDPLSIMEVKPVVTYIRHYPEFTWILYTKPRKVLLRMAFLTAENLTSNFRIPNIVAWRQKDATVEQEKVTVAGYRRRKCFPQQLINTQPQRNCRKRCFLCRPFQDYVFNQPEVALQFGDTRIWGSKIGSRAQWD